jgi:lipopolysaccharide export system protein LptC
MKYILFAMSAGLILTLIVWPQVTQRQNGEAIDFAEVANTSSTSTMTKARFVDGGERGLNVTADEVVQDDAFPEIVHLTRIEGDTTTNDGVWMHLSADGGRFDREASKLSLKGQVALFTDRGNEIHADHAVVDLERGEITGGGPVTGHGPYGRFRADAFEVREEGNLLLLSGGVRLVIETGETGG